MKKIQSVEVTGELARHSLYSQLSSGVPLKERSIRRKIEGEKFSLVEAFRKGNGDMVVIIHKSERKWRGFG